MSSIRHRDFDLRRVPDREPKGAPPRAHHGLLRRIFAAIARSHEGKVEKEAGRFIATHGGRLTDDVERQLTEHFNGRNFVDYAPPPAARRSANL